MLVALAVLVLAFGGARVRPYVTSELVSADTVTDDIEGTGDLFDGGEHSIEVTFDETEYEEMTETFREEGEKECIRADVVIDGTTVTDIGLRLKGNSTLMSLRRDDGRDGAEADTATAGGARPPGGGQTPEGMETPEGAGPPGGMELPGGTETPGGTGGRGSGELKERFLADADFEALYQRAYAELYEDLIANGTADALLEDIVARAEAAGDEGAVEEGERLVESIAAVPETGG